MQQLCFELQCLSTREILEIYNITTNQVNLHDLERILPAIIYRSQLGCGEKYPKDTESHANKPSSGQG